MSMFKFNVVSVMCRD